MKHSNELAPRLLQVAGRPFQVHGEEIFLTASMGIGVYPRDGDNVIDLIRNADAALYDAKKAGGNSFEFYSTDMNTAAVERLMLKSKLRRAFERDELRDVLPAEISIEDGPARGCRGAVALGLPERGIVMPSRLRPARRGDQSDPPARRLGFEPRLRRLSDAGSGASFAVAHLGELVAAGSFSSGVSSTRFARRFVRHGVSPTSLELEITETTLMEDPERTIRILDALYGMGLHLAIDDFGTGYSSLRPSSSFRSAR